MNDDLRDDISALLAGSDMLFCLWAEGSRSGSREIDYFIEEVELVALSHGVLVDTDNLERRIEDIVESDRTENIPDAILYSIEESIERREHV